MTRPRENLAVLATLLFCLTLGESVRCEERFVADQDIRGSQEVVNVSRAWHVTDDGLRRLRSYVLRGEIDVYMQNKVRGLVLDGTRITDEGLRHFEGKDGLVHLRDLSLADTLVTDAGLRSLVGLKYLRRVNLGKTFVFREGVSGTRVTAAGVASLQRALPNCRIEHERVPLELSDEQRERFRLWSAVAHVRLGGRGDMEALFVHPGAKLQQRHRDSLPQLKQLSELHAGGAFSAQEVAEIATLASLRQLCLRNCPLNDAAIEPLTRLTNLQLLDLSGCDLTDQGLQRMHALARLTALDVRQTAVRTAGMQQLRDALPATEFAFDPWRVVDLPYSWLKVNERFELAEIRYLNRTASRDELVKQLTRLLEHPSLELLGLRHTAVTDEDLQIVAGMANLKELDLGNTKITPAGVRHLGRLERLEKLNLWLTKLSGDGGLSALETLPRLSSLELDETRINDEALASLARMPSLKYTELWHTNVTRAGVAALQRQRPDLEIKSNPRR